MKEWIKLTEYNWPYWIAGGFALLELFRWTYTIFEWFITKFGFETKRTRARKDMENRLGNVETAIKEIKTESAKRVEMFLEQKQEVVDSIGDFKDEIIGEFDKLHNKIDEQQRETDETDRDMLRDRIAGGMRYFSKNIDEDGVVHISFSDYVNMDALFKRYLKKKGNGPFEKMYEELKSFHIDQ